MVLGEGALSSEVGQMSKELLPFLAVQGYSLEEALTKAQPCCHPDLTL